MIDPDCEISITGIPSQKSVNDAIADKLRSLLAGLCVARGVKTGRAFEITIPDDVYGMLTTGGTLKYYTSGRNVVVRYEPTPIDGEKIERRLLQ
jgi:hypothetical protein